MSIENKSFTEIDMPDIIEWCINNNQLEWLNKANAPKEYPVYPLEEYTPKKGKNAGKVCQRQNKKAAPIGTKTATPSLAELKTAFVQNFFPNQFTTAGAKAPTKDELIAAAGTPAYAEVLKKYKAAQAKGKEAKKAKAE